jgi:hypothetical protein
VPYVNVCDGPRVDSDGCPMLRYLPYRQGWGNSLPKRQTLPQRQSGVFLIRNIRYTP